MNKYHPYLVPISVKGIVVENSGIWLRHNERDEWELPGGKLDKGEQPEQTVVRELREEMGFEVEVERLVDTYLYKIAVSADENRGVLVITYLCKFLTKSGFFETHGEAGPANFGKFSLPEIAKLRIPEFYKYAIKKSGIV